MKQVTAEDIISLAKRLGDKVYDYGKAKLFNVLEATVDEPKLAAAKKLIEDVLRKLSYDVHSDIYSTLLEKDDYCKQVK